LGVFVVAVLLVSALRGFHNEMETRIEQRMAVLTAEAAERKRLEGELLGIIDCEQARIALELHDGLCQQLARTALAVHLVEKDLAASAPVEPARAQKIAALLDDAITQARSIARGLYPVKVEVGSLDSALKELCSDTGALGPMTCEFICHRPAVVPEIAVAAHLYRIVQEAVHNAVKHSHGSRIVVELAGDEKTLTLSVTDNGVGIPQPRVERDGMGLRIMQYRARSIGATLEIKPARTGGTGVCCSLPRGNYHEH